MIKSMILGRSPAGRQSIGRGRGVFNDDIYFDKDLGEGDPLVDPNEVETTGVDNQEETTGVGNPDPPDHTEGYDL